jgi:hypothetical protein
MWFKIMILLYCFHYSLSKALAIAAKIFMEGSTSTVSCGRGEFSMISNSKTQFLDHIYTSSGCHTDNQKLTRPAEGHAKDTSNSCYLNSFELLLSKECRYGSRTGHILHYG